MNKHGGFRQQVLPIGPLVAVVERNGYHADGRIVAALLRGDIPDKAEAARHKTNYLKARAVGRVTWRFADRFCSEVLNTPPQFIWGEAWWGDKA